MVLLDVHHRWHVTRHSVALWLTLGKTTTCLGLHNKTAWLDLGGKNHHGLDKNQLFILNTLCNL